MFTLYHYFFNVFYYDSVLNFFLLFFEFVINSINLGKYERFKLLFLFMMDNIMSYI